MKKIALLITLIGLGFTSCEDDNGNTIIPETQNTEKQLIKIIQKQYNSSGLDRIINHYYENGLKHTDSFFNSNNEFTAYSKHTYNSNNLIISLKSYNNNNIITNQNDITYDNQNRIITKTTQNENGEIVNNVSYTHNNNNTITSIESYTSGGMSNTISKVFYINNEGRIHKETNDSFQQQLIELTFNNNNNNIVSKTYDNTTVTYTYPENTFQNTLTYPGLGDYKSNLVLFYNSLDNGDQAYNDKHTLSRTYNYPNTSSTKRYEYTLDNENYIIKSLDYNSSNLQPEEILRNDIEYFYE